MDQQAQPHSLMDQPAPPWFMMLPICSGLGRDKDIDVIQCMVVDKGFVGGG